MLLYFVKSKNGTKWKNFAACVLLRFQVNTFILLYFLRFREGGPTPLQFMIVHLWSIRCHWGALIRLHFICYPLKMADFCCACAAPRPINPLTTG